MEQVFSGLHWKTLLTYFDGIIVIFPDFPTHLSHLQEMFKRLQEACLELKLSSVLYCSRKL